MSTLPFVEIGTIARPIERSESPTAGINYRQIGVRLWGQGAYEREAIDGSQTRYPSLNCVDEGDIIVNKIWARSGSVAVVDDKLAGCYGSGEFPTFAPDRKRLEPRWFHWITKMKWFWEACDEKSRGTSGKNRIKPELFLAIKIPLPPLGEQRRIVARIEEFGKKIEEAKELRIRAIEEASALLEAAQKAERIRLLEKTLPVKRLGEAATVTSGGTPSRDTAHYWNGTIPWIKTGELLDKDIFDSEEHITEEGLNHSSAKLFPAETVVVALYGQGQTRGRTGRLRVEAATNQACCAVLPNPAQLFSRYTQFWLMSLYSELREKAFGGAQPNWNGKMIKNLLIAVPPLAEQEEIVARLDEIKATIDVLKPLQEETSKEINALFPSVLDKAFKGEL